jgi:hypothetical protein
MRRWPAAVLVLTIASAVSIDLHAAPSTKARIFLTSDGPGVSASKEAQRLVQLLAHKLSRRKGLTVVDSADKARFQLDVRDAEVLYDSRVATSTGRTHWREPSPPNNYVTGAEQDFGVEARSNRDIVLVVRLGEGDTFMDFESAPVDHTLDSAADTVADAIERWIQRRPGRAR